MLGYAEADPSADIDAFDAAAKAAILAGLAFHTRVTIADVHREGIADVTSTAVASARDMGCVVKLLAICERTADGRGISVRVHPAMIPRSHPLARCREAYNAVFVECEAAGELMFYGRGAGGAPTASAVLGDIVAVARNKVRGALGSGESAYADLEVRPMGETVTRYHVSLDVADKAGVLAQVANEFAAHDVSIQTVRQSGRGDDANLVIVTHSASDAASVGNGRSAARDVDRARRRQRDAGRRGGGRLMATAMQPRVAQPALARAHRGVSRVAAGHGRDAGRSPCKKAARRCCRRPCSRSAPAATSG